MRGIGILIAALVALAASAGADEGIVVVEFFTSQACSSCPPADALLQEIAKQPGVLALSRPVTYWDDTGWKDTLALPENSDKQRAYAAALGGSVYTPQIVVDGAAFDVGSDRGAVQAMIEAAAARAGGELLRKDGETVVSLAPDGSEIHLIAYRPDAHVKIEAGENEGAEIAYTNVVVSDTIVSLESGEDRVALKPGGDDGLRHALVVQMPGAGPILGALKLD